MRALINEGLWVPFHIRSHQATAVASELEREQKAERKGPYVAPWQAALRTFRSLQKTSVNFTNIMQKNTTENRERLRQTRISTVVLREKKSDKVK